MRAAIFIDGGYLLSWAKKHNVSLKYEDLADYLLKPLRKSGPLDLMRCYFYYCAPWMSPEPTESEKRRMVEHDQFMEDLSKIDRFSVRLGKLQKRREGYKEYFEQKRVDVLLSVDMVRHAAAGHIQHAIVVAGDSDFIPAIDAVKESGATVSLWFGDSNTIHKDLLALADITNVLEPRKFSSVKKLFNIGRKKEQPNGR
ncbi:MAG TPA: NYN domain-containing protein [Spirochaetota bacterium]|nr:NYN domain-containing protein [Spirochaetota bacterium]